MRVGFSHTAKKPTREELEREAAHVLAARIAEGKPSAPGWKSVRSRRQERLLRKHAPTPVPAATWHLRREAAVAGEELAEGGDRLAAVSSMVRARPLTIKVFLPQVRAAAPATRRRAYQRRRAQAQPRS